MAINHTVIVDKKEDGTIELSASSPDEQAFVAGSFCQGVEFQGMNYDNNMITLNILGKWAGRNRKLQAGLWAELV